MFEIYDEPLSPKEGACLRYMVNGERLSPDAGACLRYMMSRYHQKRGRV